MFAKLVTPLLKLVCGIPCMLIDDVFYEKFAPVDPICTFELDSCNQKSMT
jgi:hypothetical protein